MSLPAYTGSKTSDMPAKPVKVLDSARASRVARQNGDEAAAAMLERITRCKTTRMAEMQRVAQLADRFDNLYYANEITEGGADHWPEDPNRQISGRAHISLNVFHTYVDVPAALESTLPVENIVPANTDNPDDKALAAAVERVYFAWKEKTDFELKSHKTSVVKRLYGRGAAKVWWDADDGMPQFSIIDQPRNLWLGWADTDYTRLDWAIYVYRLTPNAVLEDFGLDTVAREVESGSGVAYPVVVPFNLPAVGVTTTTYSRPDREFLAFQDLGMIEVHDYWYRKPKGPVRLGKKTKMETWNAIVVGNVLVSDTAYPEYEGDMPYVPVFNTYIPGVPDGKPDLYDVEQIIRDKEVRLSAGATIIRKAVSGQIYQLTGAEAPDKVPVGLKPEPEKILAPGAGNRIEAIQPWMPVFQLNEFIQQLDDNAMVATGMNDLLLGKAPPQALSSSKAVNTFISTYETRMSMSRDLFYHWRVGVWDLSKKVWGAKDSKVRDILKRASRLIVTSPSLVPRDDLEASSIAANMLTMKIWSQRRAMDRMGVEDPESEQRDIREERTDAAMFPQDVNAMAALLGTFQQMGYNANQLQAGGQGGTGPGMSTDAAVAQLGQQPGPQGSTSLNGPGEQPMSAQPGNAQEAALAQLLGQSPSPQTGPGFNAVQQTMVDNSGQAKGRILLQQPIGAQGAGPSPAAPTPPPPKRKGR